MQKSNNKAHFGCSRKESGNPETCICIVLITIKIGYLFGKNAAIPVFIFVTSKSRYDAAIGLFKGMLQRQVRNKVCQRAFRSLVAVYAVVLQPITATMGIEIIDAHAEIILTQEPHERGIQSAEVTGISRIAVGLEVKQHHSHGINRLLGKW